MMSGTLRRYGGAAAVAAIALGGCGNDGGDESAGDDGDLQVVTTVAPITSIVANIGGDLVDIEGLVPEGVDSHTFEPSPGDAEVLDRAGAVFYNGLNLEEPVRQLAEANAPDDARLVALGEETITPDEYIFDFSFPEEAGDPNPHLWTNPPMGRTYGEIVRDTLVDLDPDNAETYRANFDAFAERVDDLDRAAREATETVPEDQRVLLTYHDAYAYFAAEYGWEVVGAIEPANFGEVTAAEVADLAAQIEDLDVPAIFGSEVFPSPVLEQLSEETGAEYEDDMRDDDLPGAPGDEEHSWVALMRHNLVVMVDALGGDPAPLEDVDITLPTPDTADYPQASS